MGHSTASVTHRALAAAHSVTALGDSKKQEPAPPQALWALVPHPTAWEGQWGDITSDHLPPQA